MSTPEVPSVAKPSKKQLRAAEIDKLKSDMSAIISSLDDQRKNLQRLSVDQSNIVYYAKEALIVNVNRLTALRERIK